MSGKKKKNKWVKPYHRWVRNIAGAVLAPYTRLKYGIDIQPFRGRTDRQYLIAMNHQTVFDPFFVGISFPGAVYYLASDLVLSW